MATQKSVNPLVFFLHREERQQITGVYARKTATWDLETGQFLRYQIKQDMFSSDITSFEDDNPVFFKCVKENEMAVWDIRAKRQISLFRGHNQWTQHYATSRDRSKIVGCHYCSSRTNIPRLIRVWDAQSGDMQYEFPWEGVGDPEGLYACLTPDGQKLFCGSSILSGQALIKGWDLNTGNECFSVIPTKKQGSSPSHGVNFGYSFPHGVCALKTNRDGRLLIAVLYDGIVKIWSTSSGALLWEYSLFPTNSYKYLEKGAVLAVSPNDELLFCQFPNHQRSECLVVEIETGRVLQRGLMHDEPVTQIDFSEDSKLIVTSTFRGFKPSLNQWDWQRSPYPKPLLLESPD
ncbi:MAG: hypothetical protein NW214_08080 [Pseudanabaenaceae cyanobacterium bins.39]|nr:hypothetical protein [Pseudanabaenaceae cyanobacterium bins.39]